MREEVIVLGQAGTLVGVLTRPEKARPAPCAILLNAGIVHRVGPNRLSVRLARALAEEGLTVVRFDHAGIGDSAPRADGLPFEASSVQEVRDVMDWLAANEGTGSFVVMGLCSGTLTAFRTAGRDPRVVGVVLLNALLEDPWTIDEEVAANVFTRKIARSYLGVKVRDPRSWWRLVRGASDTRRIVAVVMARLKGLLAPAPASPGAAHAARELAALVDRGVRILFVFSEGTGVLEYFRLTLAAPVRRLGRPLVRVETLRDTDHNFTALGPQSRLLHLVSDWASRLR
jgi:pimeloyl-ACP methyl ester carboxylesterase